MKILRKNFFPAVCLVLVTAVIIGAFFLSAGATAADELEADMLGQLCRKYESGDPGSISSGEGDAGGKSYGAYQFSSAYDKPRDFFRWCQDSNSYTYREFGNRLSDAYAEDGGYGAAFDKTWKALARENYEGFFRAQQTYVGMNYYEPTVAALERDIPGFDMSNYSIALRNVIWSRAVQLGQGGACQMMDYVVDTLGGFTNQPESELIDAIYRESGEVRPIRDGDRYWMSGETAERYGVSNMVLSWFRGSSGDVQLGVYLRLRVNEVAEAQQMLAEYGYQDAPLLEGNYFISPASNTNLGALANGSSLTLNTLEKSEAQNFQLTYYASGYYTIKNLSTGQRLTMDSDGSVYLAAATVNNNQMWKLTRFNSGFSLQNRGTGKYLSTTSPTAGGRLQGSDTAMQWQMQPGTGAWKLTGASYPTYANSLQVGNSDFKFRGTLTNNFSPIQTVSVSAINSRGEEGFPGGTAEASGINANSYDLRNLDAQVSFSRLQADSYTMVITATSADGDVFKLESPFYVTESGHVVIFDACGGTSSESQRVVTAGQAYGKLPTAKKDGYVFKGWYTAPDGGTLIAPTTPAGANNITLYAHYSPAYTYQFVNYDDTVVASGELEEGDVIPAPSQKPHRPGDASYYYVFTGWEGYTEGMTISGDITFKAQYRQETIEEIQEIISQVYTIQDGYLRAIPTGTASADVLNTLQPSDAITIHKGTSAGGELAGTGMTVDYTVNGEVKQSLTLVVTGDLNGDGVANITDMVQLRAHLLGKSTLEGARAQAADLNGDGSINITDMVQLRAYLLGRSEIHPN